MIAGGIYCLLGLAILSMCLNLIHDEIAFKLRLLGYKVGLIDNLENFKKPRNKIFSKVNNYQMRIINEKNVVFNKEEYNKNIKFQQ